MNSALRWQHWSTSLHPMKCQPQHSFNHGFVHAHSSCTYGCCKAVSVLNTLFKQALKTAGKGSTVTVNWVSPRFWLMQFNLRGILLKWLPICPHIKHLRNASLGLLRLFWCAFKKAVCAEGAHSQLAGTQWLHLSLKVNTHRGGPQIRPFQMSRPPQLSILSDNEQIPIQKHLLCDSAALCCLQHTWVNEWTNTAVERLVSSAINMTCYTG